MKFKWNVTRNAAAAALAVALLASCGGGTQVESFVPGRVVVFGDEGSLINTDGTKYTVNGVVFDTATPPVGTVTCTSNQVWVQQLAYAFGLAFPGRCPGTGTNANGVMSAAVGAKAADVRAQVDAFIATNTFSNKDLVTVMVGVHDIMDALNQPNPVAAVEQAGDLVGAQIVRITERGAKVIVSTVPDVGLTPFAINIGRVPLLTDLSTRFNTRLRLSLQNVRDGGRAVGLVLGDERVLLMARSPGSFGITNTTQSACLTALPNCSALPADLVPAAAATFANDWLWADATHMGASAQGQLGALAVNRARNNPF